MKNNFLEKDHTPSDQVPTIDSKDADAWYALSNTHGMRGNLDEAEECCRRALALQPDHCEANLNLGNVYFSRGKRDEAVMQYHRVLQINPKHAVAYTNLGNVLSAMGKYAAAAANYQAAIQLNPNLFIAYYNLGNLRMQQAMHDKAANNYRRAVCLKPTEDQLNNIKQQGRLLMQLDRLEEAKALFTQICQVHPYDVPSWFTLGTINGKLGDMEEAGNCCRRILAIQPEHSEALVVLGHVYFHHRNLDEARNQYQKALAINPQNTAALNNFGKACQSDDHIQRYVELYRRAIDVLPEPAEARAVFGEIIGKSPPDGYASWLDKELLECFLAGGIDDRPLARLTAHHLRLKYKAQLNAGDEPGVIRFMIEQIAADGLFRIFLEKTVNPDAALEELLKSVRRELLFKYGNESSAGAGEIRVMCALAHQCFNNEYVFAVDPEEERRLAHLRNSIEQSAPSLCTSDKDLECKLIVFGMYEQLYSLTCGEHLSRMPHAAWSENFRPLLELSLTNLLEEENIKRDIPAIGRIADKTSQIERVQYEENPYPRWLSIPQMRRRNIRPVMSQLFPHFAPPPFVDGPIQMLIAGCGTGKHPFQAASYNNVEITAVDISKSSLAYATRMARKYGVKNVRFMQADIMELAGLDKRFHIIECVGVLHHMEDPLGGWRILKNLLVERGIMSIGLYSGLARSRISAARDVIQSEKIFPDRNNIREFRRRILKRELGDRVYDLRNSYDFYSTSECRDLLFHFKEHRFTLPQLSQAIDELNLDFIGFVFDAIKTENLYRAQFPEDVTMTNLALWDQFEHMHPTTFYGMYRFWCQKK